MAPGKQAVRLKQLACQSKETINKLVLTLKSKLIPFGQEEEHEEEQAPNGFFHTLLQIVLWLSFAAFLLASLPHVAYFFASFEPEANGQVTDYWWFVSYTLAVAIDATAFLLSLNVAVKMRRATAGKPFLAKVVPALMVVLTHWPFILLLVAFSWLVNFEHAKEFHSTMLAAAEAVNVNLIFWQGTLGDLNPVIASAFPVLAVAYTGMSDRIGDERKAARGKTTNSGSTSSNPPVPAQPSRPDALEQILQTMQAMNQQTLQAVQAMNQQVMQVTIEQVTRVTVEAVRETVTQVVEALPAAYSPPALPQAGKDTGPLASSGTGVEQDEKPAETPQELNTARSFPNGYFDAHAALFPVVSGVDPADVEKVMRAHWLGIPRREICAHLKWGATKYSSVVKPVLDAYEAMEQQKQQ